METLTAFCNCCFAHSCYDSAYFIAGSQALMSGKLDSGFTGYEPQQPTNFVFKNLFTKLLPGKYDSITNSGLPSIYPGLLLVLLAVIYFLLRQIKLQGKNWNGQHAVLFAISFYYIPLDKVWHGFQYPNWFPYRYAFLCSFTLIYMALRSIMVITQLVHKKYVLSAAITLCLLGTIIDMTGNGRKMFDGLDKEFVIPKWQNIRNLQRNTNIGAKDSETR